MSVKEPKAAGARPHPWSVDVTTWTPLAELVARLTPARLNRFLQGVVLVLVTVVALPLDYQNLRALTTPLADVIGGRSQGGDFIAFYAAGRLYARERDASPYDLDELREEEFRINPSLRTDRLWAEARLNPYRNPPFYLPVVGYLAGFPLPVAFALTTVLQGVLLGALIAVTGGLASGRALPLAAVAWGATALAYYHTWVGFNYAQLPAYVLALAFTIGVLLLRGGRPGWSGIVFALLWIKLQYLPPVILFLLVRREWRALWGLAGGTGALLLVSLLLVGPGGLRLYADTIVHLATAPSGAYFANYEWMFNWRGLLERAVDVPGMVALLQALLTVVTYALAIWAWSAPAHGADWRRDLRIVALILTMVLAGPHVHGQDLLVLLPAGALVARYLWSETLPWLVTAASALGLLLFVWAAPQQVLITPTMNFSVLLLACAFLGVVLMLRGDVSFQSPYSRPSAARMGRGSDIAPHQPSKR